MALGWDREQLAAGGSSHDRCSSLLLTFTRLPLWLALLGLTFTPQCPRQLTALGGAPRLSSRGLEAAPGSTLSLPKTGVWLMAVPIRLM